MFVSSPVCFCDGDSPCLDDTQYVTATTDAEDCDGYERREK